MAPRGLPGGWIEEIILGLGIVVLGLIIAAHPMHSLNVLAILLGVAMVVAGVYHVVHSLRRAGDYRMWGAIAGVVFFLVGIFLLRHVSLTVALIALFAGFAFIIAGIAALAEAISGRGSLGRIWSAILGVICVFAGIAAIVTPINTLARLAIVLGWAFFAIGSCTSSAGSCPGACFARSREGSESKSWCLGSEPRNPRTWKARTVLQLRQRRADLGIGGPACNLNGDAAQ